jgi:hypothetical protein
MEHVAFFLLFTGKAKRREVVYPLGPNLGKYLPLPCSTTLLLPL